MDPATYDESATLKSGLAVRVRAVRPDDKGRILEAFRNLEAESIYTRFFTSKKTLTDDELKAITEIDFKNIVGLVVTIGQEGNETIIGAGRYAAFETADGRCSAEVSFTVEEDYHGQGIAGRLLRDLAYIAREKGVSQFLAEVLAQNRPMLSVFARSGLPVQKKYEGDTVHVTLSLTDDAV